MAKQEPQAEAVNRIILEVKGLRKYFPIKQGFFRRTVGYVKAVDGVSFAINEGETVGLVGESGCGKSTIGRCLVRLLDSTEGEINFLYEDRMLDLAQVSVAEMNRIRREIQIVFQDPYSSLDPRMNVADIIAEPLVVQRIGKRKEHMWRVEELMERVGLQAYQMNRYPHEFSGGQRQRIGIARALALNPRLIVCDEPVSALDVSVQAQIINLLEELQEELNLTYLFIAHDLSVVEHMSDRVIVMYLGKIVEMGVTYQVYNSPKHPYTEALLAAVPGGDPELKEKLILEGNVPSPADPPPGCRFHTRCRYARDVCRQAEPGLVEIEVGHYAACHFSEELSLTPVQQLR